MVERLRPLREAAAAFGLSPARLRRAIRTGELRAFRPGRKRLCVLESDVARWLESRTVRAFADAEHLRSASA